MRRGSTIDAVSSLGGWLFAILLLVVVCGGLYRGCVGCGSMYLDDVREAQGKPTETK